MKLESAESIDRFCTGNVSIEEEAMMLAYCESKPELWRRVALGLVEQRRIETALDDLATAANDANGSQRSPSAAPVVRHGLHQLAIAASLLVAIAAGAIGGFRWGQATSDANVAIEPAPPVAAPTYVMIETRAPAPRIEPWEPLIPHQAKLELREMGIELIEDGAVYLLDNGEGRHVAIPERKIELRYIADSVP